MAYGWRGEGLSSEGEPERMSGRADSIGRTYQDDSERSSRRKANEAETGWSQPAHKLQTQPAGKGPRYANFYVAFGSGCARPGDRRTGLTSRNGILSTLRRRTDSGARNGVQDSI